MTLALAEPVTRDRRLNADGTPRRGCSNGNDRGNSRDRARRRAALMERDGNDGIATCYRCAVPLVQDDPDGYGDGITADRIVPGAHGGTYELSNLRIACGLCNSETGGPIRSIPTQRKAV